MITRWSSGEADSSMPEEILVELAGLVSRHPWWQARAELVVALLEELGVRPPASVMDAGCGWGVTLDRLELQAYSCSGIDISCRALERLDRSDRRLFQADLTQPLPAGHEQFDAVLALDVIEHIDDDRAALRTLGELVVPNGWLIVSVPALPDLYSHFDAIQGHRRRYLPDTLRSAFAGLDVEITRLFWWAGWMVPLVRAGRKGKSADPRKTPTEAYRRYLQLPPWPAPAAFRLAFRLEQARALAGKVRSGTSLFAVARKLRSAARSATA